MADNIKMKVTRSITVKRKFELTIDREAIIEALNRAGGGDGQTIPAHARVYFMVPGGADWSSTAIDIDDEYPIHIEWEEVEHG